MDRKPAKPDARATRDERLKAALRANLQRRKAQARAREDGALDDREGGAAGGSGNEEQNS
ncbi:MAG: hypothetical protein JSR87_13750 [Proteobacteria bacterium]|nr:hypothetical protein [Pseudomonadota bacterium]MBS0574340.1 hypothetical protein [Pseudomonadota bacterium]